MAITTTATDIILDDGTFDTEDILAAVTAADMLRVDSGTGFPTYRFLKNVVVGGATANATTYADTNVCLTFDSTRILRTRTTNTSNVGITFGQKVTSGSTYSGGYGVTVLLAPGTSTTMALRGSVKLYGCRFAKAYSGTNQPLQFPVLNSDSEIINTQLDGFSQYVLGSSGGFLNLAYNVDVTQADVNVNAVTSFFVTSAQRMSISSLRADSTVNALSSGSANLSFKDTVFVGDWDGAGGAVLNCSAIPADWVLVRPTFPPGIRKFNIASDDNADTGCHEYWGFDTKVVDAAGSGIQGIPIRLTDSDGNVQVDAVTNSYGQITYGSGLTANAVIVADHYYPGAVYSIRHRSPFRKEVNPIGHASYNDAYESLDYLFDWPGAATVTTTDGTFEDANDIISLGPRVPPGPILVDDIPIDSEDTITYVIPVPRGL